MLVSTTCSFRVFVPVLEWLCCHSGLHQFPTHCSPDGLSLSLSFFWPFARYPLTVIPVIPSKIQENLRTSTTNTRRIIKNNKQSKTNKENNLRSKENQKTQLEINVSSHNVYVLGILSSCPWVMLLQCWTSLISNPMCPQPDCCCVVVVVDNFPQDEGLKLWSLHGRPSRTSRGPLRCEECLKPQAKGV